MVPDEIVEASPMGSRWRRRHVDIREMTARCKLLHMRSGCFHDAREARLLM